MAALRVRQVDFPVSNHHIKSFLREGRVVGPCWEKLKTKGPKLPLHVQGYMYLAPEKTHPAQVPIGPWAQAYGRVLEEGVF